jgi:GR25 family glycosyltransferase involved in LPS biosynthesis
MSVPCPFYVLHYKKNLDRRAHLERSLAGSGLSPIYIEEMDREEFDIEQLYRFDPATYGRVMLHIKDNIIGTSQGLHDPALRGLPWSLCIRLAEQRRLSLEQTYSSFPFLKPHASSAGEVSLVVKHRLAYQRLLASNSEYAIVAEDDVVITEQGLRYLSGILQLLPADFDYIDLAGGLQLSPRVGNRLVNLHFYEIDPPRPRTTCCAIIRRSLAERLLAIDPPIVGGMDWMLIYVFKLMRAKVYWVEPRVFGHGSQEGQYPSNLETQSPGAVGEQ